MISVSTRGKALLVLLAVFLAVPWSVTAAPRRAAPPHVAAQEPAPVALAVRFGSWLRSLWGKAGSDIDPDGRAVVRPTCGATIGSNIDPNGLPAGDTGANIDPNG
jgi:hypothetical protein